MKSKDFEVLLIVVLARDVVDEKTFVRYMNKDGILSTIVITRVDYDILPNKKLLLAMVGDDVLAYCKHRYDIFNHTLILKNDISVAFHGAENSIFIISDTVDYIKLKRSYMNAKVPKLILAIGLICGFSILFVENKLIQNYLLLFSYWSGAISLIFSLFPYFDKRDTINLKYTSCYDKFILDIQQKLTDNKHLL